MGIITKSSAPRIVDVRAGATPVSNAMAQALTEKKGREI